MHTYTCKYQLHKHVGGNDGELVRSLLNDTLAMLQEWIGHTYISDISETLNTMPHPIILNFTPHLQVFCHSFQVTKSALQFTCNTTKGTTSFWHLKSWEKKTKIQSEQIQYNVEKLYLQQRRRYASWNEFMKIIQIMKIHKLVNRYKHAK